MVQRKLIQVLTPSTPMNENMKPEAVHLLALQEVLHHHLSNGTVLFIIAICNLISIQEPDFSSNSCTAEKSVFGFAFVDAAAGQFYVGSLCDDSARSALGALLTQV